ncbi:MULTISPECIES: LysR family transcriptional regulator [Pandoraea]|uniref:LysR family transcriptional regulator n=1 Tax=Pandoraea communis TaxID=2508297 RepID=A0A5E4SNA1_9BURK|nr:MULTISPECIES: LysR family transcriptional regulator [Pandoraea]EON12717.1 LysR family transcriptional regulator [Pandoraea sp. SD6-2]VVD76561.1 LysR family transcriptional regulator [Pandoraea communis]
MATSSRRTQNAAASASEPKASRAAPTIAAPGSPNPAVSQVPPLPALTLRQVQYFVALAHSRSFTQAAHALSVTQPALTAAIRQIEFLLGGRLFERSAHRLTLTEAGTTILPLAERLLNAARGTFDDMTSTFALQAQTVRIGFIPSVAARLLPVLGTLREAHPNVRFALSDLPNSELVAALARGEIDLGVGVRDDADEAGHAARADGFRCDDLFDDEIVLVARRDDPLASVASVTWTQLTERDLAVFVRGNVSDSLQRTGGSQNLRLEPKYRMEYTEPLYALVRSGLALAILPRLYTLHLHDPALVALEVTAPRVTRTVALMSLEGKERGPQVSACRDWIVRHLAT